MHEPINRANSDEKSKPRGQITMIGGVGGISDLRGSA